MADTFVGQIMKVINVTFLQDARLCYWGHCTSSTLAVNWDHSADTDTYGNKSRELGKGRNMCGLEDLLSMGCLAKLDVDANCSLPTLNADGQIPLKGENVEELFRLMQSDYEYIYSEKLGV